MHLTIYIYPIISAWRPSRSCDLGHLYKLAASLKTVNFVLFQGKGVFGDVGPLKIIVDNVKGNGMMVINDNRTGETKYIIQYLAEH